VSCALLGLGLPDFIIVGTQKGGTSSLYHYLCQHPQVLAAATKEVHYFDNNFHQSPNWYLRQFPSLMARCVNSLRTGRRTVTGEASPFYLMHPHTPERIARTVPDAKLIVLLRDPAYRAYSQYQHNQRMGWDPLPFEEAIDREEERIGPALQAILDDPLKVDTRFTAWSYKARGRYLEQLQRYERFFPREQMLVLSSEDLSSSPATVYRRTLDFLELEPFEPKSFPVANAGDYDQLPPKVDELKGYFAPHNDALFNHLGRSLSWA
jgi:hypothetical protein